jgi:hypothetical protein
MPYGICPNTEHRCEFSYRSQRLAHLHDLLQLIQARESQGGNPGDAETSLQWFTRYFQIGKNCRACGELLFCVTQSVYGLEENSPDYQRLVRLNHLLALTGEMQARGLLEP